MSRWASVCVVVAVGCGGGAASHRAADEYTGCGGDEQYVLFEDAEAGHVDADASQAPSITMPAAGATVPFGDKVIVAWTIDPTTFGQPVGDVPYDDSVCPGCCPQWNVGALLDFPPKAFIQPFHLPPQTGDVYDLHVFVDGAYSWRVITSLQEWTPPDAEWQKWRGHDVSLSLFRLDLNANVIVAGPFSSATEFKVGS